MRVVALAASLAGLGVSIYLTAVHYAGVPLACPAAASINCEVVLSSAYALVAGTAIPTSAMGIAWFAVNTALWIRPLHRIELAWAAAGMSVVLYLVFVEIVRLGAICVWCTAAHFLVLVVFLVALMQVLSRPAAGEAA